MSLGRFEVTGPADAGRYRAASIIDFVTAALLAILAFPFPVVRATVATPVFVTLIMAAIVVAHIVYLSVALSVWGRTPGMFLLDLGIAGGKVAPIRALYWGLGAVLEFLPRAAGMRLRGATGGLASRISGLGLGSTAGSRATRA